MSSGADAELPPLPAVVLSRIFALRETIVQDCDYLGEVLTAESLQAWSQQLGAMLGTSQQVVFQSCRSLVNTALTLDLLRKLAWRLAANREVLQAGRAVPPWRRQLQPEWVVLQFMECQPAVHKFKDSKQYGGDWELAILTGTPAGARQKHWLSARQCSAIGRTAGFSKSFGKRPWQDMAQLSGLRVFCWLVPPDPDRREQSVRLQSFACTGTLRKHNIQLLNLRFRITAECPQGWIHPCHRCPIGYKTCAAGTHANDYIQKNCVICNDSAAWFDPDRPTVCVNCQRKGE